MAADQFEQARIPLRPLAYKNRELAQTNELIIDFGNVGDEKYHVYIADSNDPSRLIDLTQITMDEIIPDLKLNGDQFEITIEGLTDKALIKDIVNHIYKRYVYPESYNNFDSDTDMYKIEDENALNTLLRDSEGRPILPVTFADNIYYKDGTTLQQQHDEFTRLTVSRQYVNIDANTSSFTFEYPYENYADDVELRINGEYLADTDFSITPAVGSDSKYTMGIITLTNPPTSAARCDFIFTYNSRIDGETGMDGRKIAVKSIPASRLDNVCHSYLVNDESAIASARAVYDLYNEIRIMLEANADLVSFNFDASAQNTFIHVDCDREIKNYDYFMCNVLLDTDKRSDVKALIKLHGVTSVADVPIVDGIGNPLTKGLPAGKMVRMLWIKSEQQFRMLTDTVSNLRSGRYIHRCQNDETNISYTGMAYELGAYITLYRNGLRLFEDVDYILDTRNEQIILYEKTSLNETIVFEALYL